MIPRYQTETMRCIWSDEKKYQTWFAIECAHLKATLEHRGQGSSELIERVVKKGQAIDWQGFTKKVAAYDREVKHDVIAFLHALEDELKEDARLIHLGLTSSDVVDTAFAVQLRGAAQEILRGLKALLRSVFEQAELNRGVLCLGRTHGQAAEATTFGIKLLGHFCELARSHERLCQAIEDIAVGKMSGAVGVYAHTHVDVEQEALKTLDLKIETVATQVVARDRHAAFFSALAVLGGGIERLALEIRLLMHGQIREAFEPFGSRQKGSSAMPHKKNPVLSENICGLMRLVRGYALAALENQALWHERDISHSSVERVIGPDATSIMEFAIIRLNGVIRDLRVDRDRMNESLAEAQDVLCSQSIMLALINKGVMRQRAYEMVQHAALKSQGQSFKDALLEAQILEHLGEAELEDIFKSSKGAPKNEALLFDRAQAILGKITEC